MRIASELTSKDGTKKFLIELADGNKIESVLIFHKNTVSACLSSQVGCALKCSFCATGRMGFRRNLTADEIIGQFKLMNEIKQITNVVFMGMGEPLMNYDALVSAIRYMCSLEFPWRKITVSTVGLPNLVNLAKDVQCKFALSLHAPDDSLRSKLMPVNTRYTIKDVISFCKELPIRKKNPLMVAYLLIEGVNDSLDCADQLAALLKQIPFVEVNLIPFNPIPGVDYERPSLEKCKEFKQRLISHGYKTIIRTTKGLDISGSCGMLGCAECTINH